VSPCLTDYGEVVVTVGVTYVVTVVVAVGITQPAHLDGDA